MCAVPSNDRRAPVLAELPRALRAVVWHACAEPEPARAPLLAQAGRRGLDVVVRCTEPEPNHGAVARAFEVHRPSARELVPVAVVLRCPLGGAAEKPAHGEERRLVVAFCLVV